MDEEKKEIEKKSNELRARIINMSSKYNMDRIELYWLLNDYMLFHKDLDKYYKEREKKNKENK